MKQTTKLVLLLAAAAVTQARGQQILALQTPLAFQITATVQGPDNGNATLYKVSTSAVRIATKDILSLIAAAQGTSFPAGSRLILKTSGTNHTFLVQDKLGTTVLDASAQGYFGVGAYGPAVRKGQSNSKTGQQAFTASYTYANQFNDTKGTSIDLNGLVQETYSWTAVDKKGQQKISDSNTLTGYGQGTVNNSASTFSEKISATGATTAGS